MIPSSAHSPQRAALAALLALTASLPLLAAPAQTGAAASPLNVLTARASSTLGDHTANKAIDGILRDDSRWVSQASPSPAWLELDLGPAQKLAGIHLYSGYRNAVDFTFQHWTNAACDRTYPYDESSGHDLLALKTQLGSTKGALPPGFSIEPNLLLHAVAQREHRSDAGRYLEAAAQQAAWMIAHLVWSHFDHGFGRNPVGRHVSYDAPREIEGVEHGWFSFYPGGIGRLADARFVIDGSPKDGHYPYHPERGNYGWTEGWVQFNTAFNISLAYLAWAHSHLELRPAGNHLIVQLEAP